jgi:hypothetical protein
MKFFIIVQEYNSELTIKILPQLNHKNYIYELFEITIEKHRFKGTTKNFVLKCIIFIRSLTKMNLLFYVFFKDSVKLNKKEKDKITL